jgi:hypothetical protein
LAILDAMPFLAAACRFGFGGWESFARFLSIHAS